MKPKKRKKCDCPIYCRFCGSRLKKDHIGHYCPQDNCQWRYGVDKCGELGVGEVIGKWLAKDDSTYWQDGRAEEL